jgi:hypothetical protein
MSLEESICIFMGTLEGKWDIVDKSKFNGKNIYIICFKLCLYLCSISHAECYYKGENIIHYFLYIIIVENVFYEVWITIEKAWAFER